MRAAAYFVAILFKGRRAGASATIRLSHCNPHLVWITSERRVTRPGSDTMRGLHTQLSGGRLE